MFKILVPVNKSYKKGKANVLVVEGIASSPSVDRDTEKFSSDAIKSMVDSVNSWDIVIKAEHEQKFYSDLWIWKEAKLIDDKMYVKGEIDLDLSLWKDIEVILNKGGVIALSVWGAVLDAEYEYDEALGKSIKVYKDVILKEISVVKNPSNYDATLAIWKSFDVEKKAQTSESMRLENVSKSAQKVSADDLYPMGSGLQMRKAVETTVTKTFSEVWKDCCECIDCEFYYDWYTLTSEDITTIATIANILDQVDITMVKEPDELQDREFVEDLPVECFVPNLGYNRMLPHHNADYTLNAERIQYQIAYLLKWGYSRLTPKEFSIAITHLYLHLLETMTKSNTSAQDMKKFLETAKACIAYKKTGGARPQVDGNDLSDADIDRFVNAYDAYAQKATKMSKSEDPAEEPEKEEAEEATKKTDEPEAPETETDEPTTEKSDGGDEDTPKPEDVTETEEGKETEKSEDKEPAGEPAQEEEDEPVETEKSMTKEQVETIVKETIKTEVTPMFDKLTKSIETLSDGVAKSATTKSNEVKKLEKNVEILTEQLTKTTQVVETIGKRAAPRKSLATYHEVEKQFTTDSSTRTDSEGNAFNFDDEVNKLVEKGLTFGDAYAEVKKMQLGK